MMRAHMQCRAAHVAAIVFTGPGPSCRHRAPARANPCRHRCADARRHPPVLRGAIPRAIATCDPDGVPNVSYLSQVEYVDAGHVALSLQFFNTARRNTLDNPRTTVLVSHPVTGAPSPARTGDGAPVMVRRYAVNDSVSLGDDYLITGVAGAIFRRFVSEYVSQQRSEFTNRELRP